MQGNGLEKESCAQLPHLVLFQAYSSEPETKENRLACKTIRAAGWLSVIRSTIYSIVIASRMLVAALGCSRGVVRQHPEDDPFES